MKTEAEKKKLFNAAMLLLKEQCLHPIIKDSISRPRKIFFILKRVWIQFRLKTPFN